MDDNEFRDRAAMLALAGLLAHNGSTSKPEGQDQTALRAYQYADALVQRRRLHRGDDPDPE